MSIIISINQLILYIFTTLFAFAIICFNKKGLFIMQGIEEVIKKIENPYVGEDCVQYMFPYSDSMTLISQDGILFHHKQGS